MLSNPHVLCMAVVFCCASAQASPTPSATFSSLSLLEQTDGLPNDFLEHFFGLPLAVRIELDGKYLGDGRVVLSRQDTLHLVDFTETHDSKLTAADRQRWSDYLERPRPLGPCHSNCSNGLMAMHYSLESSTLALVTRAAEHDASHLRHHQLPDGGSHGLILRNQLNVYGGVEQAMAARYAVDAQGSLGNWSTVSSYQLDRSGAEGSATHYSVQNLYAQREQGEHFLRAGLFLPNFQGVTRQPSAPGAVPNTIAGVMFGSSDSLAIDTASPSVYPVYITATRQGIVEIYRNGGLVYTQRVEPGLQLIDTRRLPGGIYQAEIRLVEDGKLISTRSELINKPSHWRNAEQRWRYSSFMGQQRDVLANTDGHDVDNSLAVGGVVNYLAHPRAVLGTMVQQLGKERALGGSLDWHASDMANVYTNVFHSSRHGIGTDVQAIGSYANGSVMFNHSLHWQNTNHSRNALPGKQQNTAVAINHRLGSRDTLSGRLSYSEGVSTGAGLDLSLSRRARLLGSEANWRTSVYDRLATSSSGQQRNRGVDITLSLALGTGGRRYSVGAGSRAASQGGHDHYANASVHQELDGALLTRLSGTLTADRYGAGFGGGAFFEHDVLRGDAFVQRSSLEGGILGGVNLGSTLALGGGKVVSAGNGVNSGVHTGMIVDLESDIPGLQLTADDSAGVGSLLKPGRNFVPLTAYKPGTVQLDFAGRDAPAAVIQPSMTSYHLNKGGVTYQKVKVMRTLTVIGQVHDADGQPVGGAQVRNHAGRSVTEADGFFTQEMSANEPVLEVSFAGKQSCAFTLDERRYPRQGDVVMVGKLRCNSGEHLQPVVVTGVEQQG